MTVLITVMSSLRCQRYLSNLTLSQSLLRLSEGFTLFVVYINYHVKTSINYVLYPNSYLIMGIRLYPRTDNTACLAMLIDVPQETFDRLDYIKEQCQEEKADWRDEYYERISDDEELQKADDFRVFGWSIFDYPTDSEYGDTFDPDFASRLFNSAAKKDMSKHLSVEQVIQLSSGFRWC